MPRRRPYDLQAAYDRGLAAGRADRAASTIAPFDRATSEREAAWRRGHAEGVTRRATEARVQRGTPSAMRAP